VIANIFGLVMGVEHKSSDSSIIRDVNDVNYGIQVFEFFIEGLGLLLGHMIYAKKLVIAKNNTIKHHLFSCFWPQEAQNSQKVFYAAIFYFSESFAPFAANK
jgi:hypothetical protein